MTTLIAVVSDLHAGSMLAPCPLDGVRLDDGGNYMPSKAQRWLWWCWGDYWRTVEEVRVQVGADRLYVVINGDAVEGSHHGTTQILSGNLEAQSYVLDKMLEIPEALNPDKWFVVRGTETHVGPSGSHEEAMARRLGAVQDPDTHTWSWWRLRMEVEGVRLDFQHHGRQGTRPWTRGSAIAQLAYHVWASHTEAGYPAPHLAFRSHFHRYGHSGDQCPTTLIQTPAWQLKTAHVHKKHAEEIADVGGMIVVLRDGNFTTQKVLYSPELPTPWTPSLSTTSSTPSPTPSKDRASAQKAPRSKNSTKQPASAGRGSGARSRKASKPARSGR